MKKLYERGIFGKKRKKLEFDNFGLLFRKGSAERERMKNIRS